MKKHIVYEIVFSLNGSIENSLNWQLYLYVNYAVETYPMKLIEIIKH